MRDVKERLEAMPTDELEHLIDALDQPLSSLDTGENEALIFLAELESLAIQVKKGKSE